MEKENENVASPSFPTALWIFISTIGGMFFLITFTIIKTIFFDLLRTGKPDLEGILAATMFYAVEMFFGIIFIVVPSIILWAILHKLFPKINSSWNNTFGSITAIYLLVLSVIYILLKHHARTDLLTILMFKIAFGMYCILVAPRIIFKKLKPRVIPTG
jgi:hypothetical protein